MAEFTGDDHPHPDPPPPDAEHPDVLPVDVPRADASQPCSPAPAGPLYVPVRVGPAGCAVRLFRTPLGERTVVGFTTERLLLAVLGEEQAWIRLSEPALRSLGRPLGIDRVMVDAHPVLDVPPSG